MSVAVKCQRAYGKSALEEIIKSCGCCPPMEPQCPPTCDVPCFQPSKCRSSPISFPSCTQAKPIKCINSPPCPPIPPCPPCPFVCPPCTGYPCVTSAPLPKPVPAPFECGPVVRTPLTTGGFFYTGTTRCYPCLPPTCIPPCLPYAPIPGMSVTC